MKKFLICCSVFLALGAWIGLKKIEPPHFQSWTAVIVQPGENEWNIAQTYCPTTNTSYVVDAIEYRNHTDGNINPGEVLYVPIADAKR